MARKLPHRPVFGKRILFNGQDITDICLAYNPDTGEAKVFILTPSGEALTSIKDRVIKVIVTGRIKVQ